MQSWSWKLGRIAGIPIYIHWTFLILLGWILFAGLSAGKTVNAALVEVGFVLSIFGCVVLHELGHALMARRFGVQTSDITLLPIGGVARLQRIPEKPSEELLVAIAGPLVNVVIVAILYLAGVRLAIVVTDEHILLEGGFLGRLMLVNAFLVAFNLLPAFPMDGGRMLRAVLAMFLNYGRATRIAAGIGQLMALVFVFLGLMGNPLLILIALFVWIGAGAEADQVQERLELQGIPVREAMLTDFHVLAPADTLAHAAELLLAGTQHDFPVMDGEQVVGVLTRESLMRGLAQGGRDAPVAEYAAADVGEVEVDSMLVPAVALLREAGIPCLQVVDDGRTVGLLTLENIGEYLMVRAALHERRQAVAAGR
jgi:Zn-dependent protease/CBS domain-containing protein